MERKIQSEAYSMVNLEVRPAENRSEEYGLLDARQYRSEPNDMLGVEVRRADFLAQGSTDGCEPSSLVEARL